jgi:hypothetical protein
VSGGRGRATAAAAAKVAGQPQVLAHMHIDEAVIRVLEAGGRTAASAPSAPTCTPDLPSCSCRPTLALSSCEAVGRAEEAPPENVVLMPSSPFEAASAQMDTVSLCTGAKSAWAGGPRRLRDRGPPLCVSTDSGTRGQHDFAPRAMLVAKATLRQRRAEAVHTVS